MTIEVTYKEDEQIYKRILMGHKALKELHAFQKDKEVIKFEIKGV